MIELVFLVGALLAFRETAKRRGTKAWPFMLVAAVGWFVMGNIAAFLFGFGPHMFFSWGFVGLAYGSIFLIGGGGRRMKDTWQCPDCRLYNPPSTIVCPCGYDPSAAAETETAG
jgi:hypothetical protein